MPTSLCLLRGPASTLPKALAVPTEPGWTVISIERAPAVALIYPESDRRQLDYKALLDVVLQVGKVLTL